MRVKCKKMDQDIYFKINKHIYLLYNNYLNVYIMLSALYKT
jgi:hypothetical protein